jgi:3D (Asp-Asp-Asp) domain-containing protein
MKHDIRWTGYFITPVTPADAGAGRSVTFENLEGKKFRYTMTAGSFKRAEIEAVATATDTEGNRRFGYRVKQGVWKELPQGSMGMGCRMNALVPLRHVAVDRRHYPYGSLIHVPSVAGKKINDQTTLDGWFWAADTGGMIKDKHFDLFVGEQEVYLDFLHHANRKEQYETHIYPLPKAPKGLDPKTDTGLAAVLHGSGYLSAAEKEAASREVLREALVKWQQSIHWIPEAEHGDPDAATTLWFLTHAALELDKNKS